jgi:hypothetical protein
VAGKGSSQILQNVKEYPRLTGRSCGGFPGIGRTLPSRHSLRIDCIRQSLPVCDPMLAPLARFSALSSDRNSYPSHCLVHRHDVSSPPSPDERLWVCPSRRTLPPANIARHGAPPAIRPAAARPARQPRAILSPPPADRSGTACRSIAECNSGRTWRVSTWLNEAARLWLFSSGRWASSELAASTVNSRSHHTK